MRPVFQLTIKLHCNEKFARPCAFSALSSWNLWSRSYRWIDHTENLKEGDTIAFVERLGRSPYPALVVATVARIEGDRCDLAVVSHDAAPHKDAGSIITRSVHALLTGQLRLWPREPGHEVGHISGKPQTGGLTR